MGKLNIKKIDSLNEPGKYFDGLGLYLLVTSKGSKLWRSKYRFNGQEKLASHGAYPETGLKLARDKHAALRLKLAAGCDPLVEKSIIKEKATINNEAIFSNVAFNWYKEACNALVWGKKRQMTLSGQLGNHILPAFGDLDIRNISPREITTFIQNPDHSVLNYYKY